MILDRILTTKLDYYKNEIQFIIKHPNITEALLARISNTSHDHFLEVIASENVKVEIHLKKEGNKSC